MSAWLLPKSNSSDNQNQINLDTNENDDSSQSNPIVVANASTSDQNVDLSEQSEIIYFTTSLCKTTDFIKQFS